MTRRVAALALAGFLAILTAPAEGGDRIAARVGKIPITHLEVLAAQAERPDLSTSQVLNGLIERALILAWARKKQMNVSDKDVDAAVASLRNREAVTPEQFEKALAEEGLDMETLRGRLRDQLLINMALSRVMAEKLAVSEEEIQKAHKDMYPPRQTVTVSHILLRLAADAPGEEVSRRKAEAEALLTRIQGGLPFADAARERSEDSSSAPQGGALGTFSSGELLPELEKAAEGLSPGQVAGPIRTSLGFHLLTVTNRSTIVVPLEKVRDQVAAALRDAREKPMRDAWIEELRREFYVEIFPDEQ